ncbi:MAG: peptide chain release factor N(5)-glutamine methyltransferase [Thiohalomonadales bacterium]
MNIKTALNWATQELLTIHDSAKLDAEVLLTHILKKDRSYLYTWPEKEITKKQLEQFQTILVTRKSGMPVAYLLGNKEFWSLNLDVTKDTLIPRPETELLVEQALELIPKNEIWKIADLGTGSGAIALAIAKERILCQITATDKSLPALAVAKKNTVKNDIKNISYIQSDWFEFLSEQLFNVIISNPPYISEQDPLLSQGDVYYEPSSALISGPDGLQDIRFIIKTAVQYLLSDGWLLLEHGFEQYQQVQEIFKEYNYRNISTVKDLSGHPRVTFAQY